MGRMGPDPIPNPPRKIQTYQIHIEKLQGIGIRTLPLRPDPEYIPG